MNEIFKVNYRSGLSRIVFLIIMGALLWAFTAYGSHPFKPGADPLSISLLMYSAQALFAANILRGVIVVVLAFWLAYQMAARYLDNIFKLDDISAAERFLRQAAFASAYDTIDIREGNVAFEHQKLPLFRIGGPGMVRVYLENAVVYEELTGKAIGEPHVIGPTVSQAGNPRPYISLAFQLRRFLSSLLPLPKQADQAVIDGSEFIEGFERLREVVDLRDQVLSPMKVVSRTRDGIRVNARDVRAIFHVQRGDQSPSQTHPYPYQDADVIKKVVYRKTVENGTASMGLLVNSAVADYIENKMLDEILVATNRSTERVLSERELSERELSERELSQHNGMITELFEPLSGLQGNMDDRGIDFRWIGGGTWETPYVDLSRRHLEAWQISRENRQRGSQPILDGLREQARMGEFLRLLQEIPLRTYQKLINKYVQQDELILRLLVNAYHDQILSALGVYVREGNENHPEAKRIKETLEFLTFNFHWLAQPFPGGDIVPPQSAIYQELPSGREAGSPIVQFLQMALAQPLDRRQAPFDGVIQPPTSEQLPRETSQIQSPDQSRTQPVHLPSSSREAIVLELYIRLLKLAKGDAELIKERIDIEQKRVPPEVIETTLKRLYENWTQDEQ